MKNAIVAMALLASTECSAATVEDPPSYLIFESKKTVFCDGGRTLIKVKDNRLHIWCENTAANHVINIGDDSHDTSIVGIVTHIRRSLEYIATDKNR